MSSASSSVTPSAPRLAPWRATLALLAFLALGLVILLGVQHAPRRITVDVLDLLPDDQRDPAIALARQAATGRPGRAMLFALSDAKAPNQPPLAAAEFFAAQLRARTDVFAGAFCGFGDEERRVLTDFLFERRLELRLPSWFETKERAWREAKRGEGAPDSAFVAQATAEDLRDFLATPEAMALSDLLPRDPLLLLPTFLSDLADLASAGLGAGGGSGTGLRAVGPDGVAYALVHGQIAASPLEVGGQEQAFAAVEDALAKTRAQFPALDLRLRSGGTNVLAADTRRRVEGELTLLTNLSLGLMLLLLLAAFRHPAVFAHLLLPIAAGATWAWVVCLAVFPEAHVLSVIFSTILVGVAVDYGILTLGHARRGPGGLPLRETLRRLRRPLVMGCLTSVGGFLFMVANDLPLLRQMGLSVALALVFSLLCYFAYLPWMPALRLPDAHGGDTVFEPNRRVGLAALGLGALALAGLWMAQPRWGDDIRRWQHEDLALINRVRDIRALFGRTQNDTLALATGANHAEALARLDEFSRELDTRRQGTERALHLGRVLPSAAQAKRAREWFRSHPDFVDALRASFEEAGFEAASFAPFFSDLENFLAGDRLPDPVALLPELRRVLPLPLQSLWSDDGAGGPAWFAVSMDKTLFARVPPERLRALGVTTLDQLPAINEALGRYRAAAFRLAGLGLLVLSVVVLALYGGRRGAFMVGLPAIAAAVAAAILGFLGQPIGLLQVVGLLLGICLSSDYSIFLGSPGAQGRNTRRSIRLSAATTLLSFGVLLFSTNPALKSLCLTVVLVVGGSLVLCELSQMLASRAVVAAPTGGDDLKA